MLAFPRLGEPFIVEADGSDYAVGGVLSQKGKDGFFHPVAYYSSAPNSTQQNWSPHTKEAFVLLSACRHWYVYLACTKQKDPRGKFARWVSELEEVDYTVQYLPEVDNVKADPFSRNRAASPIQLTSDFESKIYAVAIENKNFSDQIRSE